MLEFVFLVSLRIEYSFSGRIYEIFLGYSIFPGKMLFIAVPTLNLYSVGCYRLQCRQDMCGTVFACSGLC